MEQLKDIVIDVLGDFVDPKRIEIIARPGNKYWILCNCIIPIGVYSAQEMINNHIEGTDLEGKVFVYEAS